MKISTGEFESLRNWIESQCGISVGDDKQYLIETRLTRLVTEQGCSSYGEFYRKVVLSADPKLRDRIIDAMTTNETLWFRDESLWTAMREVVIPRLAEQSQRHPSRKVRIWSAACSTGQEPYSVAMLIDSTHRSSPLRALPLSRVELHASDISPSALFIAMAGRYDRISMRRGLTGDWARYKQQYFTDRGRVSLIKDEIKGSVQFQRLNLQNSFAQMGRFDLIFLRNVAIYFSEGFKRRLFSKMHAALHPGGHLILGSAESTTGYSTQFTAESHGRAVLHRPR